MALSVHLLCQNPQDDRIIPRMARALRDRLGWTLSADANEKADLLYLSAYFEAQRLKPWPDIPTIAYFTHKEEEPPGNAKAKLFDAIAQRVQLRIATCRLYAEPLRAYGPTWQMPAPVERDRFTIRERKGARQPVVGLSGYTYANHRKGEDLVRGMLDSAIGGRVTWQGSGRGWPIPTKRYSWAEMPTFYQSLDALVCPSRVEGIPMPPLEALACGVRVVIPRGVGVLDELPELPGIYRYTRGDLKTLLQALEQAAFPPEPVDRQALRDAVVGHSVEAWCEAHQEAFAITFGEQRVDGGIVTAQETAISAAYVAEPATLVARGTKSTRGIYCVAFGDPARAAALRMMTSAKRHMPEIPIALCAAKGIGPEDVLIVQPDSDVGGRRAKLRAYELAPAEWQAVLYLDADTEVVAPIFRYFEWIEDGWEFVICKDPHLMDTMHAFERRNNKVELLKVQAAVGTLHSLQWNGGVWAFGRNERIQRFFQRWQAEWEVHAQRDQGALVRAMYADPLKVLTLGNEWNTFDKYTKGVTTAGLMHYPGDARRWKGALPGRIDSPEAWSMVRRYESERKAR